MNSLLNISGRHGRKPKILVWKILAFWFDFLKLNSGTNFKKGRIPVINESVYGLILPASVGDDFTFLQILPEDMAMPQPESRIIVSDIPNSLKKLSDSFGSYVSSLQRVINLSQFYFWLSSAWKENRWQKEYSAIPARTQIFAQPLAQASLKTHQLCTVVQLNSTQFDAIFFPPKSRNKKSQTPLHEKQV